MGGEGLEPGAGEGWRGAGSTGGREVDSACELVICWSGCWGRIADPFDLPSDSRDIGNPPSWDGTSSLVDWSLSVVAGTSSFVAKTLSAKPVNPVGSCHSLPVLGSFWSVNGINKDAGRWAAVRQHTRTGEARIWATLLSVYKVLQWQDVLNTERVQIQEPLKLIEWSTGKRFGFFESVSSFEK